MKTFVKENPILSAVAFLVIVYLLIDIFRKKSSPFAPNAPVPPPSSSPTKVTFATASGAFHGGRANQVWDGTKWVQVYGESYPTVSDQLFAQELMTPTAVDANVCKCGKDKKGRVITCDGFWAGGKLICKCCKKAK